MIDVKNITRTYGDFTAVEDVSFEISPGEIVGLLGHNGAGKTTIMKMMTGYLEPTGGAITIDGLDIAADRQRIQQKIGYLPENCPVYPEMTVVGYLDYAAALHGVPEDERPARIADAIARTELQEKAIQPIAKLSRGYRQRTGVAQAILHKPAILILDEPTNGLDPTQIQHMRALITELAGHSTIIISTHILQEVQAVCNRAIIIKDGKKVLDSKLDSLQANNRLLVSTSAESDKAVAFFGGLDGISAAARVDGNPQKNGMSTCELRLDENNNHNQTAAAVASAVHEQGWQLYALHFKTRNLETVFAEIGA
jgi:ABC-2 type transport system ATP-binding protein